MNLETQIWERILAPAFPFSIGRQGIGAITTQPSPSDPGTTYLGRTILRTYTSAGLYSRISVTDSPILTALGGMDCGSIISSSRCKCSGKSERTGLFFTRSRLQDRVGIASGVVSMPVASPAPQANSSNWRGSSFKEWKRSLLVPKSARCNSAS